MDEPISYKEERIRRMTHLYYSRPEVQKAMFEFAKNREISPRYYEGFGKRPDAFQYIGDIFSLVKKGATSFHCSEEIWEDPLKIVTGMPEKEINEIRIGWDVLIDIDCKWIEYSKLAAKAIINVLRNNKVNAIGLKFSGSKGFHIIVPFKAFPKEVSGQNIKDLFPDLPRKIVAYIRSESQKEMKKILPENFYEQFKNTEIKKGIKCNSCGEIAKEFVLTDFFCDNCNMSEQRRVEKDSVQKFKCSNCRKPFASTKSTPLYICQRCDITSKQDSSNFSQSEQIDLYELMGLDLILVSPRHLFRMPYSLHEKTALSSVVLDLDKVQDFDMKDAEPMKVQVKNFMPECEEEEGREFVIKALDWYSQNAPKEITERATGKYADFKPLELKQITEDQFPPCVKNILKGLPDGKKRALFVLLHLFRSIGMDREALEKRIYEWNQKNEVQLKEGYIKSQLTWAYRRKPIMPQNCKEFYQGIGVCQPDNVCPAIKNPVNYVVRKNFIANKKSFKKIEKKKPKK
jgi:DNA primase small subunit